MTELVADAFTTTELDQSRTLKIQIRTGPKGEPWPFVVEYSHGLWHHVREVCAISKRDGVPCCIHNPSDHHMKSWPMKFRYDRGIMERTCEHGIGHPDPDDDVFRKWFHETYDVGRYDGGIHGCDRCCGNKNSQALAIEARVNLRKVEEIRIPEGDPETISVTEAIDMLLRRNADGSDL